MATIDKIIDEELSDGMLSKLEDFEIQYIKDCMIKFGKAILDKATKSPTWDDVKKAIELARKTDLSNHVNSKGADYDFSFDWAKTQQEIIAELQNKK